MPSARELIRDAANELDNTSVNPVLDAQLLLAEVVDTTRNHVLLINEVPIEALSRFRDFVDRRKNGEPIQYITGRAYFRNLILDVGPGVLIPRPESEALVTATIDEISKQSNPKVLDLGAGSGALGIAIAEEVHGARVVLVEKDRAAFNWLERNAVRAKSSIEIICSDVIEFDGGGKFDAVIANPPYIPDGQMLPDEVGNFEPAIALFGGEDGLALPRIFIDSAVRALRPGGYLAIEHHENQGDQIALLLSKDCLEVTLHYDLNGRPRWSSGVRK